MNRQVTGGVKRGQEKQPKKKELVFVSADRADFKEMIPGISKAVLWGNYDIGPYSAFTKFVPRFDAGTHSIRTMFGSSFCKVLICSRMLRAKSV